MNAAVVVLSRTPSNVCACVNAVREHEPKIPIIAVWDRSKNNGPAPEMNSVIAIERYEDFCFGVNANVGIREAQSRGYESVILMNDDALLLTHMGFAKLAEQVEANQDYGVIAAAVKGAVGNPNQIFHGVGLRQDPRIVCFICVYLPSWTLREVGLLDEEFTGYGADDDSYCLRVRRAGLKVGVYDGCVVEHGSLPSTYRTRPDAYALFQKNMAIFEKKYGAKNHEL